MFSKTRSAVVLLGALSAPAASQFVVGSEATIQRVLLVSLQLLAFLTVGSFVLLALNRFSDRSDWSPPSWAWSLSGRGPVEALAAIVVYLISAGVIALLGSVLGLLEAWQGSSLLLSAGGGIALGLTLFEKAQLRTRR